MTPSHRQTGTLEDNTTKEKEKNEKEQEKEQVNDLITVQLPGETTITTGDVGVNWRKTEKNKNLKNKKIKEKKIGAKVRVNKEVPSSQQRKQSEEEEKRTTGKEEEKVLEQAPPKRQESEKMNQKPKAGASEVFSQDLRHNERCDSTEVTGVDTTESQATSLAGDAHDLGLSRPPQHNEQQAKDIKQSLNVKTVGDNDKSETNDATTLGDGMLKTGTQETPATCDDEQIRYQRDVQDSLIRSKCRQQLREEEKRMKEMRGKMKWPNQNERFNNSLSNEFLSFDLDAPSCFPLHPMPTPQLGDPGVNYFGQLNEDGNYVYYDPIFDVSLGTTTMEVLADSGCIFYCRSVMSQTQLDVIRRVAPHSIVKESDANNNVTMKAAGSNTITVTNTVTLNMYAAHEEKNGTGTMTQRMLQVETCVVPTLSRPFILSNRDLSKFDECAVEQTTGHITFRNYRQGGRAAGKRDSTGTMVDELRIPLSKRAKRIVQSAPPLVQPQAPAAAIVTREIIHLAPHTKLFYQIPIENAVMAVKEENKEDKEAEEEAVKTGRVRNGTATVKETKNHRGSFAHPILMDVERSLGQSEHHQYMVTTNDPDGDPTTETTANTAAWTAQTLIHSEESHVLMLANHTKDFIEIPAGGTIAFVQRIEDIYMDGEAGCIALDLGEVIREEMVNFLQQQEVQAMERKEENEKGNEKGSSEDVGVDDEPMIRNSDSDVPTPAGEGSYKLDPYPWMNNKTLDEVKAMKNYRAPTEEDLADMKASDMWKNMHETDLWKESSETECKKMEQLLCDMSFVFSNRHAAGTVDRELVEHDIELTDDRIIRCRQYPLTKQSRDVIAKWIAELLNNGFIEPSRSAFRSPLLVVAKVTSGGEVKGWRTCLDARRLNAKTKSYVGNPPPSSETIMNDLTGGKVFTTTDFKAGFYNVFLTDKAKEFTAFADPNTGRLYHYVRLPMGLVGAPATFARLGSLVFNELMTVCLNVYVDDLICHTTLEHVEDTRRVQRDREAAGAAHEEVSLLGVHRLQLEATLQRCAVAGLLCALKKTHTALPKVALLGHEVSAAGIRPCPMKTAAMRKAESPKDVSGVRRALGAFGFYRRFIPRFSESTTNIRKMLKKGVTFQWTDEMEKEYVYVKELLAAAPLVTPPDYSKGFFVMSDASKVGLAGVVYQLGDDGKTERVIGYWSRSLTPTEMNYDSRELECLAVLGTLTKYRSVLPTVFTLYTDHLNLLKLGTYVSHKTRLCNWANKLSVYQPIVKHIAGAKNVVADWLSRAPWRKSTAPLIASVTYIKGCRESPSKVVTQGEHVENST